MLVIAGYIGAVLMGIVLGLIGGGGSILTFPVLVYFFGIEANHATSDSLFIVGITSFIGAIGYLKNQLVSMRSVLVFGLPSIVSVYFTKRYIFPPIPGEFPVFGVIISKDFAVTVLFALLMVIASFSMIKPIKVIRQEDYESTERYRYLLIMIIGLAVGFLAGMVGAGGGFLIIPALVILAKLPMKKAIGTSLVIIFLNSSLGFAGGLSADANVNWNLLLSLATLSIGGILIGLRLAKKIPGSKLKPAFGWFVLATGSLMLIDKFFNH
ncbi:MAG: sulfite exporter TauE/SafE family protein [Flavobacteriales bacterium]